ncbi:hypothetical protein EX30DRAFT_392339 [Ascodesmis nigricans]|uniref:Uncharacterized protein n=1 Tax=Ascodesmis nigricans TaxID=341454 RepID=A0A4S2N6M9_9PEZI|nr:hypothetical protein EX30DRAFT_392339 [Ascodesmis nigricans]
MESIKCPLPFPYLPLLPPAPPCSDNFPLTHTPGPSKPALHIHCFPTPLTPTLPRTPPPSSPVDRLLPHLPPTPTSPTPTARRRQHPSPLLPTLPTSTSNQSLILRLKSLQMQLTSCARNVAPPFERHFGMGALPGRMRKEWWSMVEMVKEAERICGELMERAGSKMEMGEELEDDYMADDNGDSGCGLDDDEEDGDWPVKPINIQSLQLPPPACVDLPECVCLPSSQLTEAKVDGLDGWILCNKKDWDLGQ